MQKNNSARTFDGPRKPRAKKRFGAAGSNAGASKKRAGGQVSRERDERPRGASGHGPSSRESSSSFSGQRGGYAPRAEREDSRGDRREGGYPRRDNQRGGRDYRDDRGGRDDRREGGYPRREGGYSRQDDRPAYNRGAGEDDRRGGYRGGRDDRREGGYPRRENGRGDRPVSGDRREGGYPRREGGYSRQDDRPAYNRGVGEDDRRGGYRGDRTDRSERRPSTGYVPRERAYGKRDNDRRPARDDRRDAPREHRNADAKPAFVPVEDVKLDRLTAVTENAAISELGFGDLGLDERIVDKLHAQGITEPFPIQAATIPDAVAGRNVLGRARTGSGKTVAYAAPTLTRLLTLEPSKAQGRKARALILAPTRELAVQIDKVVQPLARTVGLFTIAVFGGVPQHKQATGLKRGVDVIIATPGRLEDLTNQGLIDLSAIRIAIIDEADHMCELGFIEPVERILSSVHENSQKMLYSATLDAEVSSLVKRHLPDAVVHEADSLVDDRGSIDHQVLLIENRDKAEIVLELAANNPGRTIVFTRTRAYAEMLAEQLTDGGVGAAALHGDLKQAQRSRNLARLTKGDVNVLVATDVAARGIHVDDVTLVVQADAPDEYKSYLHRSGRTGRAGADGVVVTLIPRGRRRRMGEMLERAEVTAPMRDARPGDPILTSILG